MSSPRQRNSKVTCLVSAYKYSAFVHCSTHPVHSAIVYSVPSTPPLAVMKTLPPTEINKGGGE